MKSTDPVLVFIKSKKVPKNAEFHADFKSVGKILINELKKSYKPNKFDEFEKKKLLIMFNKFVRSFLWNFFHIERGFNSRTEI